MSVQPSSTAHWTYEGEEGPSQWGEGDPAYEMCGTGKSQSPIDIASASEQDLVNIVFHYQPSAVNILNNGHMVQVNYDAGSSIELDGILHDVAQFHYYAPSEHEIAGKLFPAELHLVHKRADGKLAVVGLLLQEGSANAAFDPFINHQLVGVGQACHLHLDNGGCNYGTAIVFEKFLNEERLFISSRPPAGNACRWARTLC